MTKEQKCHEYRPHALVVVCPLLGRERLVDGSQTSIQGVTWAGFTYLHSEARRRMPSAVCAGGHCASSAGKSFVSVWESFDFASGGGQVDLNNLLHRQQVERFRARSATCDDARNVHAPLAALCEQAIEVVIKGKITPSQSTNRVFTRPIRKTA